MKISRSDVLFCDGGVIARNPSPYGGTWAWCLVRNDHTIIHCDSGHLRPHHLDVKAISNNVAELHAACQALQYMPSDWHGTLYTDSQVTQWRLGDSHSFVGVPVSLRESILWQRQHKAPFTVQLCAGHPTKKELRDGRRQRNGLPTSPWNVWCDQQCQKQAQQFLIEAAQCHEDVF